MAIAESSQMGCCLLSEALNKQPGLSVIASVANYDSLLQSIQDLKPDIALISASLPGGPLQSRPASGDVSSRAPSCPWILLLDDNEPHVVVNSFRAGARGVFSRAQTDITLLAKCVRRVLEGQIWVDNRQMFYLLEAVVSNGNGNGRHEEKTAAPSLTPREQSVVRLVVQGLANREIAQHLQLSEHTIKNYLFRIFDKLGVSNRVELALYAVARLNLSEETAA